MLARRRRPAWPAAGAARRWRGRWILIATALAAVCGAAAARGTGTDRAVLAAVQRLALFYAGVFALVALTAAVAAGLVAADRIVMTPAGRVRSQAAHRQAALPGGIRRGTGLRLCRSPHPRFSASGSRA